MYIFATCHPFVHTNINNTLLQITWFDRTMQNRLALAWLEYSPLDTVTESSPPCFLFIMRAAFRTLLDCRCLGR